MVRAEDAGKERDRDDDDHIRSTVSMSAVRLRPGYPDEARALSDLALRSKAHWGYGESVLRSSRDSLRLRPADIRTRRVVVAEACDPDASGPDASGPDASGREPGGDREARLLGFATLDGRPPEGVLGMLFVEPGTLRRGVGRRLYGRIMDEAGRLGFNRLTIEADPHAVGFYTAMGAEPTGGERDGLPLLRAWPVVPDEPWVRAWSGGTDRAGAVHVGNVAEFNAWLGCPPQGRDHYSCLAVFATPRPAAIVLPEPVDHSWIAGLADTLGWAEVTVHSGVARDGRGSDALQADGSLVGDGSAGGDAPLIVPWGRTPAFQRVAPVPADVLAAIRRYESKRGAHALFERLAPGHRGIGVPAQRMARSRRELIRELRRARRARASIVLKREYGVGGFGTLVINADTPARRLRSAARRWGRGATLVEEYVAGAGPFRDLTFDAVIDGDGDVHVVGTGLMAVDGTSYQGVTVGPGVLPGALAETAARFGTAVGRALAADGYRGWYDVDFVTGQDGLLHPTEINLRLTGPAAAFMIKARLDRVRGGRHLVRTLDHLPLGARLPPRALREHLDLVAAACHRIGALAFATIPTAAFEHFPYIGMALAARTAAELDQAEAVVRSANDALRELFAGLLPGHETPAARGRRPGSAASRSVVL